MKPQQGVVHGWSLHENGSLGLNILFDKYEGMIPNYGAKVTLDLSEAAPLVLRYPGGEDLVRGHGHLPPERGPPLPERGPPLPEPTFPSIGSLWLNKATEKRRKKESPLAEPDPFVVLGIRDGKYLNKYVEYVRPGSDSVYVCRLVDWTDSFSAYAKARNPRNVEPPEVGTLWLHKRREIERIRSRPGSPPLRYVVVNVVNDFYVQYMREGGGMVHCSHLTNWNEWFTPSVKGARP